MHFGIITPPVPGHTNPFSALGRELLRRGHQVSLFHMEDLRERSRRDGLGFHPIGQTDHPSGTLAATVQRIGSLSGMAAMRYTVGAAARSTEMFLRDLPEALSRAGVGFLLVDQTEPCGATLAEHLRLPFVTICNALAINGEPNVPPPFSPWAYHRGALARVRNSIGYAISRLAVRPMTSIVARYRKRWGLPTQRSPEDTFSPLAQLSQQPPLFDFPRTRLPATFHYVGPLRDAHATQDGFPWDKLDGRPVIYASLGTLQGSRAHLFRCFAEACAGLDHQLVMSHGGALSPEVARALPGGHLVVDWAPQLKLLERCALTLTHAGMNTVLDSLSQGVPVVAIPITYEQPAIARRIEHCGTGKVLRLETADSRRLRSAITEVLVHPHYGEAARAVRDSIRQAGGVQRAASLVESLLAS